MPSSFIVVIFLHQYCIKPSKCEAGLPEGASERFRGGTSSNYTEEEIDKNVDGQSFGTDRFLVNRLRVAGERKRQYRNYDHHYINIACWL